MSSLSCVKIKNQELHRITSTAIIYKKDKYLILRRSLNKKAFPGQWTVPGGGLEVLDYINTPKTTQDVWYFALEKSLRREIKEECNLEVGKIKYLLDMAFIRSDNIPVVVLSFYAPWKSCEVILNHENTKHAWVTAAQAKNYDLIDGILQEIQMVDKILKGENPEDIKFK